MAELHAVGLAAIPLCYPLPNGECSARGHEQPCKRRGKRPLVRRYGDLATRLPSLVELNNRCFRPVSDIAINLGIVVPVGFVVVEADTSDADAEISTLLGDVVTATRSARPGRGRAWIVSIPPDLSICSKVNLGTSLKIDVRAPGGILVVPPSIHATGYRYTWDVEPSIVAAATPALMDFLRAYAAKTSKLQGTRNVRPAAEVSAAGPDRLMLPSIEERRARASGYIKQMPPAIEGSNGSRACFCAAVAAVRGFCLDSESALALLCEEYNRRCVPRWSVSELAHKIETAHDSELPRSYLLDDNDDGDRIPMSPGGSKPARARPWPTSSRGATSGVEYVSMRVWKVERVTTKQGSHCVIRFAFEADPDRDPRPRLLIDWPVTDRSRERWLHLRQAALLGDSASPFDLQGRRLRLELTDRGVGRVFAPIAGDATDKGPR